MKGIEKGMARTKKIREIETLDVFYKGNEIE
jgi:hypothetical protein